MRSRARPGPAAVAGRGRGGRRRHGTPRSRARAAGLVTVSTGDKDMAQLVDGAVKLVNTMTDTALDRDGGR